MALHYFLVAIDGTGSTEWRRDDGYNSHVYRFYNDFQAVGGEKLYLHGPDTAGLSMGNLISQGFEWLKNHLLNLVINRRVSQQDIKICLIGHSRGAAAVIQIAHQLSHVSYLREAIIPSVPLRLPVAVHFMGLYDAVDRALISISSDGLTHVENIYHARRRNISVLASSGSRGTFGVMELTRGRVQSFDTSHGGIGGDPGLFTRLDTLFADFYCNALRLVLTQTELDREYGQTYNLEEGIAISRYYALRGEEARNRKLQLLRNLAESTNADQWIRENAIRAGMHFGTNTPHVPYQIRDAHLWQRFIDIPV
jgi:hypothetical protein